MTEIIEISIQLCDFLSQRPKSPNCNSWVFNEKVAAEVQL